MFPKKKLPRAIALLTCLAGSALSVSAQDVKPMAPADSAVPAYLKGMGPLTPAQRGEAARDFVNRWGVYFQQTYKQPVNRWAIKQALVIAKADPDNVRRAMSKQTLEAAVSALRGQQMSDAKAIDFVASKSTQGTVAPMSLGDLAADLVFTPLPPCRIFDSRSVGGVVPSGGVRSYDTFPFGSNTNFVYQGGTASGNCGMPADAAAVMINIAAPLPSLGGFLTVFPYGTTRPLASNLDYQAGELKNNEIVAKSANGLYDITVYAHGSTHVVGDVVGYFIRPEATELECQNPTTASGSIANGDRSFTTVACPAGYVATGGGAGTGVNEASYINASYRVGTGWFSSVQNFSGSAKTYTHYATCCRVPGR